MNNQLNPNVSMIELGAITADADTFGLYFPRKSKVIGAWLANGATVAASDTDFFVIALKNGSQNVATFDSRAAAQNGITANTPKAMVLDSTGVEVAAGSYLKANYDETGTMAMTAVCRVIVEWFPY